ARGQAMPAFHPPTPLLRSWAVAWAVTLGGVGIGGRLHAQEGFVTTTFGNQAWCAHKDALKFDGRVLLFDLSALPPKASVVRAVLRVAPQGHKTGATLKVVPVDGADARPLELAPPDYQRFDALALVRTWAADTQANKGLRVEAAGGV